MSKVSAIIPTWNRADLLSQILPSLLAQSRPPDEIIVVDNCSTDSTRDIAHGFGVKLITLKANCGFAGAVNEGIKCASGDWLLLANNDVSFRPGWLDSLLSAAEEEKVPFATGKLLQTSDVKRLDGTWDMVSRGAYAWRGGYGCPDGVLWSQRRKIWLAPMTAALYHRSVFDRLGMLDTRFEAYYEDVDFGIRCAMAGIEGIYEPDAVAVHMGKSTLGKNAKRVMYLTARNQILLLAKHYSPKTLRRFAWPILVGQVLSVFAAASHGHFFSALSGKLEGLRSWPAFRADLRSSDGEFEGTIELALERSEREIREYQRAIGFDPYWRIYFSLVRSG
jgi:GT2 family glycosyltransferase